MFLRVYKSGGNIRVIDDVVVMFSIGGVSTKNEVTGAYIQDLTLSDRYKVNRFRARVFYIRRVVNYCVGKIKRFIHIQKDNDFISIDEVNEQLKEMGLEVRV